MSVSRRPKRFLTAEQKYDLWVRILTGQVTQSDAAAEVGVDRTTIADLRGKFRRDSGWGEHAAQNPNLHWRMDEIFRRAREGHAK